MSRKARTADSRPFHQEAPSGGCRPFRSPTPPVRAAKHSFVASVESATQRHRSPLRLTADRLCPPWSVASPREHRRGRAASQPRAGREFLAACCRDRGRRSPTRPIPARLAGILARLADPYGTGVYERQSHRCRPTRRGSVHRRDDGRIETTARSTRAQADRHHGGDQQHEICSPPDDYANHREMRLVGYVARATPRSRSSPRQTARRFGIGGYVMVRAGP